MADGSYLKTKGKDTKKKELYHYNSFPSSGYQDSNLGPPAPKAGALTGLRYIPKISFNLEPLVGFEPTTPRLQITCSGQLS